jgi:hypothetical protein
MQWSLQISYTHPGCRSGFVNWGDQMATDEALPPQAGAAVAAVDSAAVAAPHQQLIRHWLPWLIPLLAVALPLLGFVVAASIPAAALRMGEASTSLGRGDFLIPVLILCLEAIRRWVFEVKCGKILGRVGACASALCVAAVIICLYAFSAATSQLVTGDSIRSITVITWACFTVGAGTGTIAVVAATRKAGPDAAL